MKNLPLCACFSILLPVLAGADTEVTTRNLALHFDDAGNLRNVIACFSECGDPGAKTHSFAGDTALFTGGEAPVSSFGLERSELPGNTVLTFSSPTRGVRKTWTIPETGWLLQLEMRGIESAELASGTDFRPLPAAGFGEMLERVRYVNFKGSSVASSELDDNPGETSTSADWLGYRSRFWAALARTSEPVEFRTLSDPDRVDAGIALQFESGATTRMSLYLGPVEPDALKAAAPELRHLMYSSLWFPLRWICQLLFLLFGAVHFVIPHWGSAIMALSLSVAILMRPLSKIADRLQDEVHRTESRLAPRLNEIRKTSKGEEQAERILALYKKEGVNPLYSLKSLAGVMVVIPVFIGAFDMLAENIWLAGESFLWIADLARPDSVATLPFNIPFFGSRLNVLPFVMTGLSVWASWLHQHETHDTEAHRKQLQKLSLMAIAFLLLFYTFPAGMVLYWTTNNLISVIKNLYRRRYPSLPGK